MASSFFDLPVAGRAVSGTRAALALAAAIATIGCQGRSTSAEARARAAGDSSEHIMYNARTIMTSNGVRRGEVVGERVRSFDAVTLFRFQSMRVQFTTALGRPLGVLTAPTGAYSVQTSVLDAAGPVRIQSDTSGRRIETNAVRYDAVRNQLASDSAFVAVAGSRRLTGVGFTADPGLFSITCVNSCSGSLGR